ncbi:MAG: flagellar type III secretion system protein FlhB [Pseudomonadota bacterium]
MSEQNDNSQERNLPPTPKRLADARKKGQVARSRELNTLLITLGGGGIIWLFGASAIQQIASYSSNLFVWASGSALRQGLTEGPAQFSEAMAVARDSALTAVLPILVGLTLLALAGPLMTGGVIFRLAGAAPKASNINPGKGLKRMFSVRALVELGKAILKFVLVGAVGIVAFRFMSSDLMMLGRQDISQALASTGGMLLGFFLIVCLSLLVIAAIDVPFQLFQHFKKLKMSHQELRDEHKDTEGRPEVKQRIRSLQMQAATRRLEIALEEATVVVTNPTHYAVALKYDEGLPAPVVLARGAGVIAEQIRKLAAERKLPVVSAPPLARSLFFSVKEGEMVPAELFRVVAKVIIYVMQLAETPGLRPPKISDEDIPEKLRREAR